MTPFVFILASKLLGVAASAQEEEGAQEVKCSAVRNTTTNAMTSSCNDGGFIDGVLMFSKLPEEDTIQGPTSQMVYVIVEVGYVSSAMTWVIDNAHKLQEHMEKKNEERVGDKAPLGQVVVMDCRKAQTYSQLSSDKIAELDEEAKNQIEELSNGYCTKVWKPKVNKVVAPSAFFTIQGCGGKQKMQTKAGVGSEEFLIQEFENYYAEYCKDIVETRGLEGWQIAIIVITVLLFLGMVGALVWCLIKRKNSNQENIQQATSDEDEGEHSLGEAESYGTESHQGGSMADMNLTTMSGRQ